MQTFDFSSQGRRPSVKQIIARWERAMCPTAFEAVYGETFAVFEKDVYGQWFAHGNGQRGIDRDGVLDQLGRISE